MPYLVPEDLEKTKSESTRSSAAPSPAPSTASGKEEKVSFHNHTRYSNMMTVTRQVKQGIKTVDII